MKNSTRRFSLVSVLLFLALLSFYPLSAQEETTLHVGDAVEDVGRQIEFLLDAEEGQTVTLRWEGTVPYSPTWFCPEAFFRFILDAKTELTNADGDTLEQLDKLYLDGAMLERYMLAGRGPYHLSASICGASGVSLNVLDGNGVSENVEPAMNIGETRSLPNTAAQQNLVTVIPLDVQTGDVFTVRTHFINRYFGDDYPDRFAIVRDGNGRIVPTDMGGRLRVDWAASYPVYTVSGTLPYRLKLVAIYPASYAYRLSHYSQAMGEFSSDFSFQVELQPGNTVIDDGGTLEVGSRVDDVMRFFDRFYTLDVAGGELVTFSVVFHNSEVSNHQLFDGTGHSVDPIDYVPDEVNGVQFSNPVYRMGGPEPYTLMLQGAGSYTLMVEAHDSLNSEDTTTSQITETPIPLPTCTVSTNSTIDVRRQPSLYEPIVGTLISGTNATVDGFSNDSDTGETWWYRLSTGGWVPRDQVTEITDCAPVEQASGYFFP